MRQHHVYLITHIATGRHYVGKTSQAPAKRWHNHKWDAARGNTACARLYRAMRKYGIEAFAFRVIETYPSELLALHVEACWIAELETQDEARGFNICAAGPGSVGRKMAPESCRKISEARKREIAEGRRVSPSLGGHTEAAKAKMRHPKRVSEEERAARRERMLLQRADPEWMAQWRESNRIAASARFKKLWEDPEYRAKMTAVNRANNDKKRR
jgi:group I intron endonuclease